MALALLYYGTMVYILIRCTYEERLKKYRMLVKALASLGFVIIAVKGYTSGEVRDADWFYRMFPAFLLCMSGDVFLAQSRRPKQFTWLVAGGTCFLLGHLVFIAAFCWVAPLRLWDLVFPFAAAVFIFLLSGSEKFEVRKMRWGVMVYAFFITIFWVKGVSLLGAEASFRHGLVCVGSFLFLVSDGLLYVDWFGVKRRSGIKVWNLSAYYGGMLLLALSVGC